MNWKEVTISQVTPKGIITKKVSFPENSIYFTICREIDEMERKERKESSGSENKSGRKSSRRK